MAWQPLPLASALDDSPMELASDAKLFLSFSAALDIIAQTSMFQVNDDGFSS